MAKPEFFKNKGSYETRKDLLIHYLKELHNSNKPIGFSDLLLHNLPGGGIMEFESVMTELENKGWILKKEQDSGPIKGLPFHRGVDRTYSITLEGVEFLAEQGEIDSKHSKKKTDSNSTITNYGNMVVSDKSKDINQSLSSPNNLFKSNSTTRIPTNAPELPIKQSTIAGKWSFKNIINKIYKWTDHKLISGIILIILGILIGKLIDKINW